MESDNDTPASSGSAGFLLRLIARRDVLQAELVPLQQRLERCDAAIARADEAQKLRDRLIEEDDRGVAEAIASGRARPPMDPQLNLAEIQLRRAKGEERAALKAREGILEELQQLHSQLGQIGADLENETWAAPTERVRWALRGCGPGSHSVRAHPCGD